MVLLVLTVLGLFGRSAARGKGFVEEYIGCESALSARAEIGGEL